MEQPLLEDDWSTQQTAKLGSAADSSDFLTLAPIIPKEENISGVSAAVDGLNSGKLLAPHGVIICYSKTESAYYALWKKDAFEVASAAFNLVKPDEAGEAMVQRPTSGLAFNNAHGKFMGNLRLAITTAMWAVIFGLPMFSSVRFHDIVFGTNTVLGDHADMNGVSFTPHDVLVCSGSDIHSMVYDINSTVSPSHMVPWQEDLHGEWVAGGFSDTSFPQFWCGILPQNYIGTWPNVIQMLLFTAYFTTGVTVMQAWQGIMGTFLATANAAVMGLIYPTGALAILDSSGIPVEPLQYLNHYNENVAFANVAIVTFLFLVCKAEANTIKFGLSWHMTYMMQFVNPAVGAAKGSIPMTIFGIILPAQWDSYRTVVLFTSIAGAVLAVLATLIPFKLLNISLIKDDAQTIVKGLDSIWKDSIDYICGDEIKGKGQQIAATIDALQDTVSSVNSHVATAWWETMDFTKLGRSRVYFEFFDHKVGNETTRNLLQAVKGCVLNEDFDDAHNVFCKHLQNPMNELRSEVTGLMQILIGVCKEGACTEGMANLIDWKVGLVQAAQKDLLRHYESARQVVVKAGGSESGVGKEWAHEYTFIFALSHWANSIMRFGVEIQKKEHLPEAPKFLTMCKNQVKSTFHFSKQPGVGMFAQQHWNFTMRNFISISLAFFLGIFLNKMNFTMYRGYSSTMSATLSLLISSVGGSAMEKNLKRLLGVVLGKVIPIIIIGNLDYFGCQNSDRFMAQGVAVFGFIFAFEYIYFTSSSWGYVGGLIAAFGCYPLFTYPTCDGYQVDNGQSTFITNYEELCEVTTAILLQMLVDVLLEFASARQIACENVENVGTQTHKCLTAFFQGGVDGESIKLRELRRAAVVSLDAATAMIGEVDPMKVVAPGSSTPFQLDLYKDALGYLRLVLGDLSMIIMAIHEPKDHQEEDSELSEETMSKILSALTTWTKPQGKDSLSLQEDALTMVMDVSRILLATLSHTLETPIMQPEEVVTALKAFEEVKPGRAIQGRAQLYEECANKVREGNALSGKEKDDGDFSKTKKKGSSVKDLFAVRISVIVVALDNIVKNMGMLGQVCVKGNIH